MKPRRSTRRRKRLPRLPLWLWLFLLMITGVVVIVDSPIGKPEDTITQLLLSDQYGRAKRMPILAKSKVTESWLQRRHSSSRPRSITLTSDGRTFGAYLLDLSSASDSRSAVEEFMKATDEAAQGRVPESPLIIREAVDVDQAEFDLSPWWPIGRSAFYMLIVASDDSAVTVRVSYGR